jgi:hypothetical protein
MNKERGYIKKTIVLYIHTSIGDRWKNKDEYEFLELKGRDGYVVDEKDKTNE